MAYPPAYPPAYPNAYGHGRQADAQEIIRRNFRRDYAEAVARIARPPAQAPPPPVKVKASPPPPARVKATIKRQKRPRKTIEAPDTIAWWMKWGEGISDDEPREMTLPCYEFELSTDAPAEAIALLRYSGVSDSFKKTWQ